MNFIGPLLIHPKSGSSQWGAYKCLTTSFRVRGVGQGELWCVEFVNFHCVTTLHNLRLPTPRPWTKLGRDIAQNHPERTQLDKRVGFSTVLGEQEQHWLQPGISALGCIGASAGNFKNSGWLGQTPNQWGWIPQGDPEAVATGSVEGSWAAQSLPEAPSRRFPTNTLQTSSISSLESIRLAV